MSGNELAHAAIVTAVGHAAGHAVGIKKEKKMVISQLQFALTYRVFSPGGAVRFSPYNERFVRY